MATMIKQKHLSDKVRVALVMGGGKIKPVWFEQTDRPARERIKVEKVTSTWTYYQGAARIICFAVWDGSNTYNLEMNTTDYTWSLGIAESSDC
jgi:hypothetical protein